MNSLKIKILFLTTAIMVAAITLITWHNLRTQKKITDHLISRSNRILGETIRNTIVTGMARGHDVEVGKILANISREPNILAARIFDVAGHILSSADPDEVGERIPSSDYQAYREGKYSFSEENGVGRISHHPCPDLQCPGLLPLPQPGG